MAARHAPSAAGAAEMESRDFGGACTCAEASGRRQAPLRVGAPWKWAASFRWWPQLLVFRAGLLMGRLLRDGGTPNQPAPSLDLIRNCSSVLLPPSVRSLITMRNVIEHFSRILQNKIGIGLFLPRIPRELALGDVINNTVASRRAESTGSSAWSMAIA